MNSQGMLSRQNWRQCKEPVEPKWVLCKECISPSRVLLSQGNETPGRWKHCSLERIRKGLRTEIARKGGHPNILI